MKKYAMVALIAFFTVSLSVSAQNNSDRNAQNNDRGQRNQIEMRQPRTAKERAETMERELKLTAAQTAQVQALFEKQDAQRAEQFGQRGQQRQQAQRNQEEMRALRERVLAENDAELGKIIGAEKLEQWKKYRDENSNNRMRNTR
jgi:Spy/CpxP family protein refolding chaperone